MWLAGLREEKGGCVERETSWVVEGVEWRGKKVK